MIEAKAHFDAPERTVNIRVGGLDGRLYLDLCDETWRAVEIDATGWRVIDNPPVRFRRAAGMQPLPMPMRRRIGRDAALCSSMSSPTPTSCWWSPGRSRLCAIAVHIRCSCCRASRDRRSPPSRRSCGRLLDPNTAPLRALPREDRDLFIAASNGHVLAFDNVSGLPAWISDTLCRLATGGGFAVRQLYTDQDEVLFDAARPVILNGIEDIVTRPDLADRAVFLTLEPIPEERRRPEAGIVGRIRDRTPAHPRRAARCRGGGPQAAARDAAGEAAAHGGFRAVGDGVRDSALACRHLLVGLLRQPRRGGGGRDRRRPDRRRRARHDGDADGVDGDRLGPSGRPAEVVGERVAKSKTWPDSPRALAGRLRRAATFLRKVGIEIGFRREGRARTRTINITTIQPSAAPEKPGRNRPHRPHRPRPCRNPIRPTASRLSPCGR